MCAPNPATLTVCPAGLVANKPLILDRFIITEIGIAKNVILRF
jgi:hypothetical protein